MTTTRSFFGWMTRCRQKRPPTPESRENRASICTRSSGTPAGNHRLIALINAPVNVPFMMIHPSSTPPSPRDGAASVGSDRDALIRYFDVAYGDSSPPSSWIMMLASAWRSCSCTSNGVVQQERWELLRTLIPRRLASLYRMLVHAES
jgi:hypothetical protein